MPVVLMKGPVPLELFPREPTDSACVLGLVSTSASSSNQQEDRHNDDEEELSGSCEPAVAALSTPLERSTTIEHLAYKTETDPSWGKVDYLEKARMKVGYTDDDLEIKHVRSVPIK